MFLAPSRIKTTLLEIKNGFILIAEFYTGYESCINMLRNEDNFVAFAC